MENTSEKNIPYIPMPYKRRYYFSWLFGGEDCYTQEEMLLRQAIRELRLAAALPEEIQDVSFAWFLEDKQALVDIYEGAWFFASCYKPNETPKLDNFSSRLLRHDVVSWPEFGKYVLELGDYLIIRNKHLPMSHYNQPMNYVLMDIRRILERLAGIKDEQRLLAGLKPVRAYIASIERQISPIRGGDHVFLTNLRAALYHQEKHIIARISRQGIRRELENIKHAAQNLAQKSHAILHFSFARGLVNAHPHLELLQKTDLLPIELLQHPVSGAVECLQRDDNLHNCPFIQLTHVDKEPLTTTYRRSIGGLQSLLDFVRLLDKALAMTSQTGEIYSLFEMHAEFQPILRSIGDIAHHQVKDVQMVLDENQAQYKVAVQTMQRSGLLSRWFGSAVSQAETVLGNQDAFSLFKIDADGLSDSNEALQVALGRLHQHFVELSSERAGELVQHARATIGDFFESTKYWQEKYASLPTIKPPPVVRQDFALPKSTLTSIGLYKAPNIIPEPSALAGRGCMQPTNQRPLVANLQGYSYFLVIPLGIVSAIVFLILLHRLYQYCTQRNAAEPEKRALHAASR